MTRLWQLLGNIFVNETSNVEFKSGELSFFHSFFITAYPYQGHGGLNHYWHSSEKSLVVLTFEGPGSRGVRVVICVDMFIACHMTPPANVNHNINSCVKTNKQQEEEDARLHLQVTCNLLLLEYKQKEEHLQLCTITHYCVWAFTVWTHWFESCLELMCLPNWDTV